MGLQRGEAEMATLTSKGLVLSSSSHTAPLAGVSFAVEDDSEEDDDENESEEEEEEVLFSQRSKLDIFRGGEWVSGGLGNTFLLASLGLEVVTFMYQEAQTKMILYNFLVTWATAGSLWQ